MYIYIICIYKSEALAVGKHYTNNGLVIEAMSLSVSADQVKGKTILS